MKIEKLTIGTVVLLIFILIGAVYVYIEFDKKIDNANKHFPTTSTDSDMPNDSRFVCINWTPDNKMCATKEDIIKADKNQYPWNVLNYTMNGK